MAAWETVHINSSGTTGHRMNSVSWSQARLWTRLIRKAGALYTAITTTIQEVVEKGGRYDECDLYGRPGGYTRLMDKQTAGQPCPVCSMPIESIQYLGGSCYFYPVCQS